jgi:non-specific serine/threonine protein kinase
VRLLPPAALLARLASPAGGLPLLTGGVRDAPARHRTLRDAVAWSHGLLSPAEQALFRRLGVFAGGFSLEAVEAVGDPAGLGLTEVEGVASLVDKSLVTPTEAPAAASEARYRLLETIREYALERLAEAGEAAALRERHAGYYLALAERGAPAPWEQPAAAWLDRLEREHDNLRAALRWATERGRPGTAPGDQASVGPPAGLPTAPGGEAAALGLRLGAVLWRFWLARAHAREGRAWLDALLGAPEATGSPPGGAAPAVRAAALTGAGTLAWYWGDYAAAGVHHAAALALWRAAGDRLGAAVALLGLGHAARAQGDLAAAGAHYTEALASARAAGDDLGAATARRLLGYVADLRGDGGAARAHYEASLAPLRAVGDRLGVAASLAGLGEAARARGDLPAARALHAESLALRRAEGDRRGVALSVVRLAGVAAAEGQPQRAARLLGAAEAYFDAVGLVLDSIDRVGYDRVVAAARTWLGAAAFAAARAEGRALPLERAAAEALAPDGLPPRLPAGPAGGRRRYPGGVTEAEVDVLRLVALGRSNREVAAALTVDPGTVRTHLDHVYTKLAARSRFEAVARARELGLDL